MRLLALRAETMQAMRRLKLPCDDITPIGLWGSDMFLIGVNNDQFEVLRLWNVQTEDVTPATLRDLHTDTTAIPTSPSAGNAASGARSSASGTPSAAPSSSSSSRSDIPSPAEPAREMPVTPPAARAEVKPASRTPDEASGGSASSGKQQAAAPAPRREPTIDLQPAFEAVAQQRAPEAPAVTPSAGGAGRAKNGASGSPSVSGAPASDRDSGPELRLETNTSSTSRSSRSEEGRGGKSSRDADAKAARESAKEPASNAGKLRMTVDGEHLYAEIKGGKIVLKDRTYDSLAHARDSIRRERNKVAVWEYFDEGVKAWRVLNRD